MQLNILEKRNEVMESSGPIYPTDELTSSQTAFREAGKSLGHIESLGLALENIYSEFLSKEDVVSMKRTIEQNEFNKVVGIKNCEIEILYSKIKDIEEKIIPAELEKVNSLEIMNIDSSHNPEWFNLPKFEKFSFYTLAIPVLFVILFLILAYFSSAYSAFFREFDPGRDGIFNSIFYSTAIGDAWNKGALVFLICLAFPTVFILLAVLIHKMWEDKKRLQMCVVAGITIMFDIIIAFSISKKLHDSLAASSFRDIPNYSIGDAFFDVNFYVVIFCGLVTYIILAFAFHYMMLEYSKKDAAAVFIKRNKEEAENIKAGIKSRKDEVSSLKIKIDTIKMDISKMKKPDSLVMVHKSDLIMILNEYAKGWVEYLAGAGFSADDIRNAHLVLKEFKIKKQLEG